MISRKEANRLAKLAFPLIIESIKAEKWKAAWLSTKLYLWLKLRCPKTRYLP